MAREIEAKFRLRDPHLLRTRLRELDATQLGCVLEANHIFDTRDRRLRGAGCGLRVRTCRPPGNPHACGSPHDPSAPADQAARHVATCDDPLAGTLTFKGPRSAGELKSREEIETVVADASAIIAILQRLGLEEVVVYEKRRESWRLGDCEVTLDELPRLGWYSEIEGPSPASIAAARGQLNLADAPLVQETYPHLAATHGETDDHGRRRLLFKA